MVAVGVSGSLPGDRGFDPLGLAKPVEYLQFEIDQQDQNKAVAKAGDIVGQFKPNKEEVSTQSLQPYSEVFSLQRFRECELIHGKHHDFLDSHKTVFFVVLPHSATLGHHCVKILLRVRCNQDDGLCWQPLDASLVSCLLESTG